MQHGTQNKNSKNNYKKIFKINNKIKKNNFANNKIKKESFINNKKINIYFK